MTTIGETKESDIDCEIQRPTSPQHVVDALKELVCIRSELLCMVTQTELRSQSLQEIGFSDVQTTRQYSPDDMMTFSCSSSVRALLLIHVGFRVDASAIDALRALNKNETLPLIIFVLILPDEELSADLDDRPLNYTGADSGLAGESGLNGRGKGKGSRKGEESKGGAVREFELDVPNFSHLRQPADDELEDEPEDEEPLFPHPESRIRRCSDDSVSEALDKQVKLLQLLTDEGADDFLVLEGGQPLQLSRMLETLNRVELYKEHMLVLEQQVKELRRELSSVGQVTPKADRAQWSAVWRLLGHSLLNVPQEDRGLREAIPQSSRQLASSSHGCGVGDYIFNCYLGRGSMGTVFLATARQISGSSDHGFSGVEYAVKVIPKHSISSVSGLAGLDQDLAVISNLPPHPNIIRAHDVLHGKSNIYVVTDSVAGTTLGKYLKAARTKTTGDKRLAASEVQELVEQMAFCVFHLHNNKIYHGELKPSNFMVQDVRGDDARSRDVIPGASDSHSSCHYERKLILIDLRLSRVVVSEIQRVMLSRVHTRIQTGSSPSFAAPEMLSGEPFQALPADIWMLALNFIELSLGSCSVDARNRLEESVEATRGHRHAQSLEDIWKDYADVDPLPGLHRLIGQMLVVDADQRPTMKEIAASLDIDRLARTKSSISSRNISRSQITELLKEDAAPPIADGEGPPVATVRWRKTVEKLVPAMFNKAFSALYSDLYFFTGTTFAFGADQPELVKVYVDILSVMLSRTDNTNADLQSLLSNFNFTHEWSFRICDWDFELLLECFVNELRKLALSSAEIEEAQLVFGDLRDCATRGFHETEAQVKLLKRSRILELVQKRIDDLARCVQQSLLRSSLSKLMEVGDPKYIQKFIAHFSSYMVEEEPSPLALPLDTAFSHNEAIELLECFHYVIAEFEFNSEACQVMQFSLWASIEWLLCYLAVMKLRSLNDLAGVDLQKPGMWMHVVMTLHAAVQARFGHVQPTIELPSKWFAWLAAFLTAISAQETSQSVVRKLIQKGARIISHRQLDVVSLCLLNLDVAVHEEVVRQLLTLLKAMRPFIVQPPARA